LLKEIDILESGIAADGSNITTYRARDIKAFVLDLIAYCITKEE
jgi:hypothetical protein